MVITIGNFSIGVSDPMRDYFWFGMRYGAGGFSIRVPWVKMKHGRWVDVREENNINSTYSIRYFGPLLIRLKRYPECGHCQAISQRRERGKW